MYVRVCVCLYVCVWVCVVFIIPKLPPKETLILCSCVHAVRAVPRVFPMTVTPLPSVNASSRERLLHSTQSFHSPRPVPSRSTKPSHSAESCSSLRGVLSEGERLSMRCSITVGACVRAWFVSRPWFARPVLFDARHDKEEKVLERAVVLWMAPQDEASALGALSTPSAPSAFQAKLFLTRF